MKRYKVHRSAAHAIRIPWDISSSSKLPDCGAVVSVSFVGKFRPPPSSTPSTAENSEKTWAGVIVSQSTKILGCRFDIPTGDQTLGIYNVYPLVVTSGGDSLQSNPVEIEIADQHREI